MRKALLLLVLIPSLAFGRELGGVPGWEDYIDGQISLARGKHDRAMEYFRMALAKDTKNTEAIDFLVFASLLKGDSSTAQAIVNAGKANSNAPKENLVIQEALLLFVNRQGASLRKLAEAQDVSTRHGLVANAAMALNAYRNEDWDVWSGTLAKLQINEDPLVTLLTALDHGRKGEHGKAADSMQAALSGMTSNSLHQESVNQILGIDFFIDKQSRALVPPEDGPKPGRDQLALYGYYSYYRGRFGQSRDAFQMILEDNPTDQSALLQQAISFILTQTYPQALASLRQLLQAHPDHIRGRKLYAASLGLSGQREEAVAAFEKLKQEGLADAEVLTNLGVFYLAKGKAEEAEAAYQAAIELNESYPDAYRNYGTLLARRQEHRAALEKYQQGVRLNPLDGETCKYIGLVEYDLNNVANARRWLIRASNLTPGDPGIDLALSICDFEDGNYEEALRLSRRVSEALPKNPQAHFVMGRALAELGNIPDAIAAVERALEVDSEVPDAADFLAELKEMGVGDAKPQITFLIFTSQREAQSFKEKARNASAFDAAAKGRPARTVTVEPGSVHPDIEAAARKLDAGKVSEIIEVNGRYFVFKRL